MGKGAFYYPAFLNLRDRFCVVVGGGEVAERKVEALVAAGARVRVIAPEVTSRIEGWAGEGLIELEKRPYREGDLSEAWLVVAATDDPEVQKAVFSEAERNRIFCNVVDKPELCSFIVPSVVRRGRLQLAVSTSGASPAAARRIRERLEEEFGPEWGVYLELMARWRKEILSRGLPEEERRQIFTRLAMAPLPEWIRNGDWHYVRALVEKEGLSLPESLTKEFIQTQNFNR
ncbi:bifunctional precorrin-2 dehydrogenase/sirohydrochlorin ferrochelatase [Thermosulfurimonas sp. F29]|uniref:precorrin-2 dehydrogenase/sirohydrochlorin ferrochelatase family protein n=1 Tax=Thermosulfurimonas sp. F29 TaxID=2867247 RepID=UPI001C82EEBB|nr:bifunctional precorrin-2 dehydrogenase/sirohydrochlorin ferrochelatase [Thermosulfurimonas sp. F29]MBX6422379.1 bifunctional precorrin-2 dehydrogenase/sirohydrochlorin ferrochelatase [Thermosulfurimonas sp. F29]